MSLYQIIPLPVLPLGMVNAHAIRGPAGVVLVDAGLPGTETRLQQALARHRLSWTDVRLIVITHAHVDHAGNAAALRRLSGAPIVAQRSDLPYYRQERTMSYCPTGWFGRLFLRTGAMHPPWLAFEPDVVLNAGEQLDLGTFGLDGAVVHTPGHTAGSLSVQLNDGQALVGDLLASGLLLGGIALTSRPRRPPFEDDASQVAVELQRLLDNGQQQFFLGHGGPLPARAVQRHVKRLLQR